MRLLKFLAIAFFSAFFTACDSPSPTPQPIGTTSPAVVSTLEPVDVNTPIVAVSSDPDDGRHRTTSTPIPTSNPTVAATKMPTPLPTSPLIWVATPAPSFSPTPSPVPTLAPTIAPTFTPAPVRTATPTQAPTLAPTVAPSPTPIAVFQARQATVYAEYTCSQAQGFTAAQWATLRKYVDVTDRQCNAYIAKAKALGMISGAYTDPSLPCTATSTSSCGYFNEAANYTNTSWARTCAGQQIFYKDPSDGHNTFTDPSKPSLVTDTNKSNASFKASGGDFVMVDNIWYRTSYGEYTGSPGGTTMPSGPAWCGYTDLTWIASETSYFSQLSLPVMFNGDTDGALGLITASPNVKWGMCEDCFSNGFNETTQPARLKEIPPIWQQEEQAAIVTHLNGKSFLVFDHGWDEPHTNDVQLYAFASYLETYADGLSGLMSDGSTPSGVNVSPIVNFVATGPLLANLALLDVDQLNQNGVYVREYAACSLSGHNVGACAAIINPSTTATNPAPRLVLSYAGILNIDNWCGTATIKNLGGSYCYKGAITEWGDTGSVTVSAGKLPATLAPQSAYILTGLAPSSLASPKRHSSVKIHPGIRRSHVSATRTIPLRESKLQSHPGS